MAAQMVRQVALQTALYKLESPIEPGVFNTEIKGFTIYVKEGNLQEGTWGKIFIHNEDQKTQQVRLITSKSGRIDTNDDSSELVLENAVVSTFSTVAGQEKFISENVGEIRFGIQTKRKELIEKLTSGDEMPDEMGLSELSDFAGKQEGKLKTEAQILWARRVLLSVTPLLFAVLGTGLVLRFSRGGRGFGIFLALLSLIIYYLIALLGEQLARTGFINVFTAGILPILASLLVIIWLYVSNRLFIKKSIGKNAIPYIKEKKAKLSKSNFYIDLTTGILDLDIILNLLKYFVLTVGFLTSIYLIFTAFELWKFAGTVDGGIVLLIKYLFYLLPFIYIQLAPSALMIAVLATYLIKSGQNEIVTWTAAGQSVYRLLLPCFALMVFIGLANWGIQEFVAPSSNLFQDELRAQIRNQGILAKKEGKYWLANDNRIYSFNITKQSDLNKKVNNVSVYEFSAGNELLRSVITSREATWENGRILFSDDAEKISWSDGKAENSKISEIKIVENFDPLGNLSDKPSHLSTSETIEKLNNSEPNIERRKFEIALQKKHTTPLLPLIVVLFTAPFALSLSAKSKVIKVGYAVGYWLLFMGIGNVFEQYGLTGYVSPEIAVWSPLLLFSIIGLYLLTRLKT